MLGNLGDNILSKITLKSGVGAIVQPASTTLHGRQGAMRFRLTDLEGQVVRLKPQLRWFRKTYPSYDLRGC